MFTEEQISQKVDETYKLMGKFRGNPQRQRLEHRKLTEYLNGLFQQDTDGMLDLFWQLFREERGVYEEIFLAIIDVPCPEAIRLASQIMVESNEHLREEAAKFLYDVKDPETLPYLIEALKSKDYNVVSKSVLALGNIGDSRAEPYLLEIVDRYNTDEAYSDDRIDDAYPIIRSNTFDALCLLNTPSSRQKILQSLFHDRDIGIQQRAIRYLVAEMPMEAPPYLEELCKHSNEEIATLAKDYLAELSRKN
jgi:HEAT repeat protein